MHQTTFSHLVCFGAPWQLGFCFGHRYFYLFFNFFWYPLPVTESGASMLHHYEPYLAMVAIIQSERYRRGRQKKKEERKGVLQKAVEVSVKDQNWNQ